MKEHEYKLTVNWTGDTGSGTSGYKNYSRSHSIIVTGKVDIAASSDPEFLGDKTRHSPEDLFLASLSSCHMLWYLHLCAEAKIIVIGYEDNAIGTMIETENGSGSFTEVVLNPVVTVTENWMTKKADELHRKANEMCFIANSVNFLVGHKAVSKVLSGEE